MSTTERPRCPRCKDGYLGPDWEGLTCVNCGYNWAPSPPVVLDKPVNLTTLTCAWCGGAFTARRLSMKFCTNAHRQKAKRANQQVGAGFLVSTRGRVKVQPGGTGR